MGEVTRLATRRSWLGLGFYSVFTALYLFGAAVAESILVRVGGGILGFTGLVAIVEFVAYARKWEFDDLHVKAPSLRRSHRMFVIDEIQSVRLPSEYFGFVLVLAVRDGCEMSVPLNVCFSRRDVAHWTQALSDRVTEQ